MTSVTFTSVDPEEILNDREARHGRVSYPIVKGFMDSGLYVARVNLPPDRKVQNMYMLLKSYVFNHREPVKILQRKGTLYMMRLDIDKDGNKVEDWFTTEYPLDTVNDGMDGPGIGDIIKDL